MNFIEKLKSMQDKYMFLKYAGGNEYGKLVFVGNDFIEFDIIDITSMEYQETLFINPGLIIEILTGGSDIQRLVAELSCKLTVD